MSAEFLDETGLAYFWGKLKAWASSIFVHLTGNESITGVKVVKSAENSSLNITDGLVIQTDKSKDSVPSADKFYGINIFDNATLTFPIDKSPTHRVANLEYASRTTGAVDFKMQISKPNSTDQTSMFVGFDANGIAYAVCPSTSENRNGGLDIVTRDWIPKDTRIVHRTDDEVISGEKTFNNTIKLNSTSAMCQAAANSYISITGGVNFSSAAGGKLVACGVGWSTHPGDAYIQGGDSSGYKQLVCSPSEVYTSAPTIRYTDSGVLRTASGNHSMRIYSGANNQDGASLQLFGYSATNYTGNFYLRACTRSGPSTSGDAADLAGTATGSLKWNGQPVQTSSDERLKTDFGSVPDGFLDAWLDVDWMQFRFKADVERKGSSARLHAGLVAQRVDRLFRERGLDACAYGILCHDVHDAFDAETKVVDAAAYTDEDGVFHEERSHVETEHVDAVDLWTVRYTEALCMEAVCMRRENARLKRRVADLEDRLAALELRLGSE